MNPSRSGPRCPYCGEAAGCVHLACSWDDLAYTDPENELRGAGIDSDRWEPFESFHREFHAPLAKLAGVWTRILLEWLYPFDETWDEIRGTPAEESRAAGRLEPLILAAAEGAQRTGDCDRALWSGLRSRAERLPHFFLAFQYDSDAVTHEDADEDQVAVLYGLGFAVGIAKWLHADRELAVNESRVLWEGRDPLGALFAETHELAEALRHSIVGEIDELTRGLAAGLSRVTATTT